MKDSKSKSVLKDSTSKTEQRRRQPKEEHFLDRLERILKNFVNSDYVKKSFNEK